MNLRTRSWPAGGAWSDQGTRIPNPDEVGQYVNPEGFMDLPAPHITMRASFRNYSDNRCREISESAYLRRDLGEVAAFD
jgi:hypothetical protein